MAASAERDAQIRQWKDANNNAGTGQLKGILRSGSPTTSSRSRSTTPEEEEREQVARLRYTRDDEDEETESETEEEESETEEEEDEQGSEIERPNPFRKEFFREDRNANRERSPRRSPPPRPPPILRKAEIVHNDGLDNMREEWGQGEFTEYQHDTRTNTVREVRGSTHSLTSRSVERIPDFEKIELIAAKFDVLPTKKRAEFVHENFTENALVHEDTHRQVLLEENRVRNEMLSRSTNPFLDTCYEQESQHSPSPVPHSPMHWSGSTGQLHPQLYPPVQVLPVHYTKLPTPQHTIFTYTQSPMHIQQQPQQPYGMPSYNYMVSDHSLLTGVVSPTPTSQPQTIGYYAPALPFSPPPPNAPPAMQPSNLVPQYLQHQLQQQQQQQMPATTAIQFAPPPPSSSPLGYASTTFSNTAHQHHHQHSQRRVDEHESHLAHHLHHQQQQQPHLHRSDNNNGNGNIPSTLVPPSMSPPITTTQTLEHDHVHHEQQYRSKGQDHQHHQYHSSTAVSKSSGASVQFNAFSSSAV